MRSLNLCHGKVYAMSCTFVFKSHCCVLLCMHQLAKCVDMIGVGWHVTDAAELVCQHFFFSKILSKCILLLFVKLLYDISTL